MGTTIFYRHPARPDEAGISYVPDIAHAAAMKDQLVKRGFRIVKVVPTPVTAISGRVRSPPATPHLAADD
jgi:hypothetical protein